MNNFAKSQLMFVTFLLISACRDSTQAPNILATEGTTLVTIYGKNFSGRPSSYLDMVIIEPIDARDTVFLLSKFEAGDVSLSPDVGSYEQRLRGGYPSRYDTRWAYGIGIPPVISTRPESGAVKLDLNILEDFEGTATVRVFKLGSWMKAGETFESWHPRWENAQFFGSQDITIANGETEKSLYITLDYTPGWSPYLQADIAIGIAYYKNKIKIFPPTTRFKIVYSCSYFR